MTLSQPLAYILNIHPVGYSSQQFRGYFHPYFKDAANSSGWGAGTGIEQKRKTKLTDTDNSAVIVKGGGGWRWKRYGG